MEGPETGRQSGQKSEPDQAENQPKSLLPHPLTVIDPLFNLKSSVTIK
jgi:hypothetical protein